MINFGDLPGVYVVSDTFRCDGTGIVMQILKNLKKKTSYVAEPGNFSHLNYLFKKNNVHVSYAEIASNLEVGDLPMIEDPPSTWVDAPKRVKISEILAEITKMKNSVIVIDDVYTILSELGDKGFVGLVNGLREICEYLIIKANKEVIRKIWMIEVFSDVSLEVSELESGFTTEYQGKVRVSVKENFVKSEIGCFWYKIINDSFEIIDS